MCFDSVTAALYVISGYIGPFYGGSRLFFCCFFYRMNDIKKTFALNHIKSHVTRKKMKNILIESYEGTYNTH